MTDPSQPSRVRIDTDICTGHGRCYMLVPDLFEADERGFGVVRGNGEIAEQALAGARRAEANCPEGAIFLEG
ncbi:MAG: ferredoxin [Acidimicrobiales bacterium]